MTATKQLEVIHPDGKIEFYRLDSSRGITNIGCHPTNDIILGAPGVAPFHAMLDHREEPYHVVALSVEGSVRVAGQPLLPHLPRVLAPWESIDLPGYSLVLLEALSSQDPLPLPVPLPVPTASPCLAAPLPDARLDFVVEPPAPKQQRLFPLAAHGEVVMALSNRGAHEARFRVEGREEDNRCLFTFQLPNDNTSSAGFVEFTIPPAERIPIRVRITPRQRPHLLLETERYHYTLITTLLGEQPRTRAVAGQVERPPLIGFGLAASLTLCLAVLGTLFLQHFRPPQAAEAAILPTKRHLGLLPSLPTPLVAATPAVALSEPAPGTEESAAETMTYEEMFKEIAPRYGLDWRLLAAVAYRESTLNPQALGKSGDMGLMQIMPATWDEVAPQVGVSDPYDAYSNALVGAAFLSEMRAYFTSIGYPQDKWMLLAYNWGPNNLRLLLQSEGGWAGWPKVPVAKQRYAMGILQLASDSSASWWREEMQQPVPRSSPP